MNLQPLIVSAPFGNHLSWPGATSTLGTATRKRRGGTLYRLWRLLWTLRYDRHAGGWVNRLGLPNPGIESLCHELDPTNKIISIHGFDQNDWHGLAILLLETFENPLANDLQQVKIELNLSCPNVAHRVIAAEIKPAVKLLVSAGVGVIAKLPPVRPLDLAIPLLGDGVRAFHCCNTLSVAGGGLSGKPLKQLSLCAVESLRACLGKCVTLIGGGGVTCRQDIVDYHNAGANHVAVGSYLLNPWHWHKMPDLIAAAAQIMKPPEEKT